MTTEPIRLLEQGDVTDVERDLLTAGRSSAPVEYDVVAGSARFRAELATLVAAGAVTAVGSGTTRSAVSALKGLVAKLGVKIALGVMASATFAGIGLVAGMHVAQRSAPAAVAPPPKAARAAPAAPAALAAPPVAPRPSASSALLEPPVVAPADPAPLAPAPLHVARRSPGAAPGAFALSDKSGRRSADALAEKPTSEPTDALSDNAVAGSAATASARAEPPPAVPPSAAPPPAPPVAASDSVSEIRGVALARSLVVSDPEAALNLLDKVRHDHPNGYFVEERQALTVIALARLGKQAAARQQAAAFLRAYPNGPFSDRVRSVATP
jgi:hypothetical protein